MLRFVKPDLTADRFSWSIDENAIADAQLFDGKLALITNAADLTPAEAVTRYKGLADIDIDQTFRLSSDKIELFCALPGRQALQVGRARADRFKIRDHGRVGSHQFHSSAGLFNQAAA
jgi:hypothetical protein